MDHEARPRSSLGRALLRASSEASPPPPDFLALIGEGRKRWSPGPGSRASALMRGAATLAALAACAAALLVLLPSAPLPGPAPNGAPGGDRLWAEDAAGMLGRESASEALFAGRDEGYGDPAAVEATLEDEVLHYVEGLWSKTGQEG